MNSPLLHYVEKAVVSGAITGLATCFYFGSDSLARVNFLGQVRLCYVGGAIGSITSVLNDVVHNYVLNEIPINKKAEEEVAMVLGAGTGALMYHFCLGTINPKLASDTGLLANASIGAGSELGSSFLFNLLMG